jgi:3'-phosphoadenosine 5'-phosphosulfate sulfotransferase (PAPS reductase)/FAD synthetase
MNRRRKRIVSFSGGKDSTAMLLLMAEREIPFDEVIFFDTGWEFPAMYDHISQVEQYIGRPITIRKPAKPFTYWLFEHPVTLTKTKERYGKYKGMTVHGWGWPNWQRRWCTGLKIDILSQGRSKDFSYIGIAADESDREKPHFLRRYPLRVWGITEKQALELCYKRGFYWGGLYEHFARVSCFCCPLQRTSELETLYRHYPDLWQLMLQWDQRVFDGFGQFKNGKNLTQWTERFCQEKGEHHDRNREKVPIFIV